MTDSNKRILANELKRRADVVVAAGGLNALTPEQLQEAAANYLLDTRIKGTIGQPVGGAFHQAQCV